VLLPVLLLVGLRVHHQATHTKSGFSCGWYGYKSFFADSTSQSRTRR